eukprot:SAG11_NODE_2202_length_3695_cov_2.007508_1_plen_632_part_00
MTQTRLSSAKCPNAGPFGAVSEQIGADKMCRFEEEFSEAPYGVDPTFVQGTRTFRSSNIVGDLANISLLEKLFTPDEIKPSGVPFGFFFGMGSNSGADYPVLFDVNKNRSQVHKMIDILDEGNYFDQFTSTVEISMVLLNVETQWLTLVTIDSTWTLEGRLQFDYELTLVDVSPYTTSDDFVRLAIEIAYLVLLVILIGIEGSQMYNAGSLYFTDVYNITDVAGYAMRVAMVVIWIINVYACYDFEAKLHYDVYADPLAVGRILQMGEQIGELQAKFSEIQNIANLATIYEQLCTFSIIVMVVQLIQKLNFHPRMGVISRTVSLALGDLFFYFLLLSLIVTSYAYLGCLLYGKIVEEFSGIITAIPTMMLTLSGMYDYTSLPDSDSFTCQLFFWSYMVVAFFIMLNALLAIIVDSYSEVSAAGKQAGHDPLVFAISAEFGCLDSGLNYVQRSKLLQVLEAWTGAELDERAELAEQLENHDEVEQTERAPKQPRNLADYSPLNEFDQEGVAGKFYELQATYDTPYMILDMSIICVAIQATYEHYEARVADQRQQESPEWNHHSDGLSHVGISTMASNILARFGSKMADGGKVTQQERDGITRLLQVNHYLDDETTTAREKLALAYNHLIEAK